MATPTAIAIPIPMPIPIRTGECCSCTRGKPKTRLPGVVDYEEDNRRVAEDAENIAIDISASHAFPFS
jgi:hypothetical protein